MQVCANSVSNGVSSQSFESTKVAPTQGFKLSTKVAPTLSFKGTKVSPTKLFKSTKVMLTSTVPPHSKYEGHANYTMIIYARRELLNFGLISIPQFLHMQGWDLGLFVRMRIHCQTPHTIYVKEISYCLPSILCKKFAHTKLVIKSKFHARMHERNVGQAT